MRIRKFSAGLLVLLGASGCLSWHVSTVRDTTTNILGCPKEQIIVRETQKGWVAGGCGKSVVCSDTTGPCLPMVCIDVAMTDYRECGEKQGKFDGDCLSVYTNAIRACVLEEVRGMSVAAPPSATSPAAAVAKTEPPPEPAKPVPAEAKVAAATEPAKAAAGASTAPSPPAKSATDPAPPQASNKAPPTGCTAPQIADMIKLGLTTAQISAACPQGDKASSELTNPEKELKGRLALAGKSAVSLFNDTTFRWTGCEVRLPQKKSYKFPAGSSVAPGANGVIGRANFKPDSREPDQHMLEGYALVNCDEAQGYLLWGKEAL